ncbi:Dolichyl-phosphate-mannose-protein mannosyltransferase-domain-containing protein [Mycena crocata]|nr:Dolichyl-phosphate-mannose-protein mannosyltransferase-domain-containing protein [Mycena crocata]
MNEQRGARRRGPKGASAASTVASVDPNIDPIHDDGGKDVNEKLHARQVYGRRSTSPNLDHVIALVYTLLSFWTRFYKIGYSKNVVWDEAHFGKFGSHYLKREFYFDVHPPLGKMLVGLAGLLAGYDGGFEFKSGEAYPEEVPFVAMRMMLASFGVGMVPLGWYTAVELGMSRWACHLVALMVLLDVGLLCISRFILLDSMLLFFTVFTVFCMTKFNHQQSRLVSLCFGMNENRREKENPTDAINRPFSSGWWTWLAMTGVAIGCTTR